MMRAFLFVAVIALASAVSQRSLTPGHRFKARKAEAGQKYTPGGGCNALSTCASCTSIKFCMWHKSGACHSESSVPSGQVYNYYQGSCGHLAGDWTDVNGAELAQPDAAAAAAAAAATEDFSYRPLMMQPPAIANQDEDHIFQGGLPRPDYGMGELGYKLQGMDPYSGTQKDWSNTPRNGCAGDPLRGCLEKPVILPGQGGGDYKESENFRQKPNTKKMGSIDDDDFVKPHWEEEYDNKDDI